MKSHLTLKIFLLIILSDFVDTAAQLIMKKGLAGSPLLTGIGVLVYVLNFFIWIVILYKVDLSIAMPVGSFSYILVPIAAIIFLNERVDLLRWAGICCIVLGIYFVTQSKKPAGRVAGHG